MKLLLLTGALFFAFGSLSQWGNNILKPIATISDSLECPWNSADSVLAQPNYSLFHTQNNIWDGPIDSNYCLYGAEDSGFGLFVFGGEVDSARPVFIETRIVPSSFPLIANTNYRFHMNPDNPSLIDTDCSDSICSKLYLQIRKPNAAMNGDTLVTWELSVIETQQGWIYACFVTEKFD